METEAGQSGLKQLAELRGFKNKNQAQALYHYLDQESLVEQGQREVEYEIKDQVSGLCGSRNPFTAVCGADRSQLIFSSFQVNHL